MPQRSPIATPELACVTTKEADHLIPLLAKDRGFLNRIKNEVHAVPTQHDLHIGDARDLSAVADGSIHLVVTSPPYWTLKEYNAGEGQLGAVDDYQEFHRELGRVWRECLRVLVPGGRMIVVVGDVVVSRRTFGRHKSFPLHADIQVQCEHFGFDNLTPILWAKIANASFEAAGHGGGFLGKPFEPGSIIKSDLEYILMFRKPGGYRSPDPKARLMSIIGAEEHRRWFTQIWSDIPGASLRDHPAPFPIALAERLIRMFSFVGDVVLDPFVGTGTTMAAAMRTGRNSKGIELDREYAAIARSRLERESASLEGTRAFRFHPRAPNFQAHAIGQPVVEAI